MKWLLLILIVLVIAALAGMYARNHAKHAVPPSKSAAAPTHRGSAPATESPAVGLPPSQPRSAGAHAAEVSADETERHRQTGEG